MKKKSNYMLKQKKWRKKEAKNQIKINFHQKKQIKNRLNFAKTIIYPIFTTP